jgi:hypothetical protein
MDPESFTQVVSPLKAGSGRLIYGVYEGLTHIDDIKYMILEAVLRMDLFPIKDIDGIPQAYAHL